ncbi:MAG: methyl-accepting chemotaxis protein [Eubacterium sp.]|nr:methyl-accepting chemotaxis protein [Eubacterium sp.]
MKFKKIGTRMVSTIIPVILAATILLTVISITVSRNITENQVNDTMSATLSYAEEQIVASTDTVKAHASTLGMAVSAGYKDLSITKFEQLLQGVAGSDDMVLGCGLWFEPYVFDASEKYMGPYVYKDGDDYVITYDYSNADYDYFSQEYYTNAMNSLDPVITDPYYDETTGTIMASCSSPVLDTSTNYLGCVTVDIELSSIQEMINSITIGEKGYAILLASDGTYLAGSGIDAEYISNSTLITADANTSLAEAGAEIIAATEDGMTTYKENGKVYNLYYSTISDLGWKILITVPQSQLFASSNSLAKTMILILILTIIISTIIIIMQVRYISRGIKNVQSFAGYLASGDFTVEPITVSSKDEIGSMSTSLNEMFESNHEIISNISVSAGQISSSSEMLSDTASQLKEQFENIKEYMSEINNSMLNASAATEEVNASVEEVNASVSILATETDTSMQMARDIKERADSILVQSQESYDSATHLSKQFEEKLAVAIENAKVVETIGSLANTISDIAEEINLLSLNASIEAARAGEQGKGFAVVATEIGGLANSTAETVNHIQQTISSVQDAFNALTEDAKGMLEFVQDTVTPDYNSFVNVANQYGEDAKNIAHTSDSLKEMTDNIHMIMNEVTDAIQSIAEAAQTTADVSSSILDSVDLVNDEVVSVNEMSEAQRDISQELATVVSSFKLS